MLRRLHRCHGALEFETGVWTERDPERPRVAESPAAVGEPEQWPL